MSTGYFASAASPRARRVVVAGMGAVTALGSSVQALWEGVSTGRVAIRPVHSWPMEAYHTRLAGEIQEVVRPLHEYPHPRDHREPTLDFALKAAEEAIAQAGLTGEQISRERWGLVLGTCMAGFLSIRRWYIDAEQADPQLVRMFLPQDLAEMIGEALGLRGPVLSLSTACAAGANAIGYALDIIRNGHADVMLAGGTDSLSDVLFAGFHCLESLAPDTAAPYSRDRQGLSLGEGGGMLLLVREDLARAAGVRVLGEVLGYGLSADGYHPTAPDPEGRGASRAIRAAMREAGVRPEEVGYINGHGTGTPKNDVAETRAIRLALGEAASQVGVSSTKSMVGHLMGAAGAVEAIVTLKALQEQVMPPTANYTRPDPACDLHYVPLKAEPRRMEIALSNNFAFGGNNACVAFGRAGAARERLPRPQERVVITGMSLLSPAGDSPAAIWRQLLEGGLQTEEAQGCRVARIRQFEPASFLPARERRRIDRVGLLAIAATRLALSDADLAVADEERETIGILLGTAFGPLESIERFYRPVLLEGTAAANPAIFPSCVFNAAAGLVAIHTGLSGPTSTVTAGHAAGAAALCYAYELISSGRAVALVCLGVDTLTEKLVQGYSQGTLVARREGDPQQGQGFILAEGAGALLLESLSHAQARGARIYGEIAGYGMASDPTVRQTGGLSTAALVRAMTRAREQITTGRSCRLDVWANAAGDGLADRAEAQAIRRLLGPVVESPFTDLLQSASDRGARKVFAPLRALGVPGGAGALFSAALALYTSCVGTAPWRRSQSEAEEGAGTEAAPVSMGVLVNSCSLGGTHISLALRVMEQVGLRGAASCSEERGVVE